MSKYNNKKVLYMGEKFDSQMEADYYKHLLNYYPKDDIKLQPIFELQLAGIDYHGAKIRPITYVADFKIYDKVIDIKGFMTADFKLKLKMLKYKYPLIDVILIKKAPAWHNESWIELSLYNKLLKERKKMQTEKCLGNLDWWSKQIEKLNSKPIPHDKENNTSHLQQLKLRAEIVAQVKLKYLKDNK